jgi:segregation and condensation protein A
MEENQSKKKKRGNLQKEIKKLSEIVNVETEMQDLDLYKLLKVFKKVLARYEADANKPVHKIIQYPYTIEEQKTYILKQIEKKGRLSFLQIVKLNPERIAVVYNFLAILELLQAGTIRLNLGEGYNNFWIEHHGKKVSK